MRIIGCVVFSVLICVNLVGCEGQGVDGEVSSLPPEQQYELAIQRRADLSEFQRELVEALGASDWGPAGEPDHATASRCREDDREHFAFKRRQRTADDLQPFIQSKDREDVLSRFRDFSEANGMTVQVEPREDDTYVYADSADFHALLRMNANGKATLIVETSCSEDWPDFDLTVQEFSSLDSRRRFPTETQAS